MTHPALHHRWQACLPLLAFAAACAKPTVVGGPSDPPGRSAADAADATAGPAAAPDAAFVLPPPPAGATTDGGAPAGAACPGTGSAAPRSCADLGVVVDPFYAGRYTCFDLGPVPGLPPQKYGGLTLTTERCSSTLLIGGDANLATGKLYAIQVTRDAGGHINGFSGSATVFADAPYNDGGIAFAPNGALLFSRWPNNELQITRAGSQLADKVIDLQPLGVAYASASLNFVPAAVAPGGALKLVSWSGGQWYTVNLQPDGQGTFDVPSVRQALTLPGGPEGFVYVAAGSPQFPVHSLLVSEWSANQIATYEVDAQGDPKLGTRRPFITGLQGAEGAYRDPPTGDFFFSTWGQAADRTIVVRGFAPVVVD
jgi:hypothetical protein